MFGRIEKSGHSLQATAPSLTETALFRSLAWKARPAYEQGVQYEQLWVSGRGHKHLQGRPKKPKP